MPEEWWREAVLYQVYPRSFADSDGDGIGDLRGLIGRLDHLEWLGVDGIWLSPIHPSPNEDWGYDVADYRGVHPDLGTLADLDELIAEAGRRGIRVLLDLVANHTSIAHPWFRERPELYVWADEPNNWRSVFDQGSAWTLDPMPGPGRGRYYLHTFAAGQPDLDWRNPDVHDEFRAIMRFWLDRGVAGFRLDVVNVLYKDADLRDDPPAGPDDHDLLRELGLRHVHSMNQPETHAVLREWRELVESYEPARVLVGEVYAFEVPHWAEYYGDGGDQLHLSFNFQLFYSELAAAPMRDVVADVERELPPGAWPCWAGSNHDGGRLATRWAGGDERRARCGLLVLLGLRGTPFLYYGDELALPDGEVPAELRLDRAAEPRDGGRTPMPWTEGDGGWRDPWLPLRDTSRNVEAQRADPGSTLHFTRDLIALRRRTADLRLGGYEPLDAPAGVWAWRRGGTVVALNLGGREAFLQQEGTVAISTDRTGEGEPFGGRLPAGAGVVLV